LRLRRPLVATIVIGDRRRVQELMSWGIHSTTRKLQAAATRSRWDWKGAIPKRRHLPFKETTGRAIEDKLLAAGWRDRT